MKNKGFITTSPDEDLIVHNSVILGKITNKNILEEPGRLVGYGTGWNHIELNGVEITPDDLIFFDFKTGNITVLSETRVYCYNYSKSTKLSIGLYSDDNIGNPDKMIYSVDIDLIDGENEISLEIDKSKKNKAKYYALIYQ